MLELSLFKNIFVEEKEFSFEGALSILDENSILSNYYNYHMLIFWYLKIKVPIELNILKPKLGFVSIKSPDILS